MAAYLLITRDPSGQGTSFQLVTGADLAEVKQKIRSAFAAGVDTQEWLASQKEVALIRLDAAGRFVAAANGVFDLSVVDASGPAIPDLPAATITTLAQSVTAINAIGVKVNTILGVLRDAGLIAKT